MTTEILIISLLGWCSLINIIILTFWFLLFAFARDFVFKLHTKWFSLSEDTFYAIHYGGMMAYKMAIMLFFFIPWVLLRFVI